MAVRAVGAGVPDIELMDFTIQPINLFFLVNVIVGLRAVVVEPGHLWRVHQAGDGHSVGDCQNSCPGGWVGGCG